MRVSFSTPRLFTSGFDPENIKLKKGDDNMLNLVNSILARASQDRYEIRVSKNGIYYLYDYDFREIVRSKVEIRDIIDNQFLEEFTSNPDVFTFLEKEVF